MTTINLSGCTRERSHLQQPPEALAAAYGRISRSSECLETLRDQAYEDYGRAERSCNKIVHGMGHQSIQEHVVLNFDMEGISRLAVEDIEHHRLASYTERSYRYCEVSSDSVYIPEELTDSLKDKYIKVTNLLLNQYILFKNVIKQYYVEKLGWDEERADKQAQDDARYITPLCLTTSIGMTINTRSLSYMIKRLKAARYNEANDIGEQLLSEGSRVAPVLLRHTSPIAYDYLLNSCQFSTNTNTLLSNYMDKEYYRGATLRETRYYNWFKDFFSFRNADCIRSNNSLVEMEIGDHDPLPRYTEFMDVIFICSGSAVFYAQLKRHRMASILTSDYNPKYGFTLPVIFSVTGLKEQFIKTIKESERLYTLIKDRINKQVASYILTSAHRKNILVKMNLRELHHFIKLRADRHAGKEIRFFAKVLNKDFQDNCYSIDHDLKKLIKGKKY